MRVSICDSQKRCWLKERWPGVSGVSEALNGSILKRCSFLIVRHLVFWYVFFVRKVLCMQFGTLAGFVMRLLSFQNSILTWLQRRIAVAFLNVLGVVKAAPQARPKTT